jgi:hypothetical protein
MNTHTIPTYRPARFALMATVIFAVFMYGCVTINIYFPASAAEKAADKIIDEIWQGEGKKATGLTAPLPTNDKTEKP